MQRSGKSGAFYRLIFDPQMHAMLRPVKKYLMFYFIQERVVSYCRRLVLDP